jgi:hypothetical protein
MRNSCSIPCARSQALKRGSRSDSISRAERSARAAQLLNLRLRIAAKRILGRNPARDRAALAAALAAETAPELPPAPSGGA